MLRIAIVALLLACSCKSEKQSAPAAASPVCVDGTEADCRAQGMDWTGKLCCAKPPVTCGPGVDIDCRAQGGKWTGKQCCMSGAQTCVDGTDADCRAQGMTWTGTQCCSTKKV